LIELDWLIKLNELIMLDRSFEGLL